MNAPPPFSKSGIGLKGLMEPVCMKVNGGGVTFLKFHAIVDDNCVFYDKKGSPILSSLWRVKLREYELV